MVLFGMLGNSTEDSTPHVPRAAAFLMHVCQRSHWSYGSQSTDMAWVMSNCVHGGKEKQQGWLKGRSSSFLSYNLPNNCLDPNMNGFQIQIQSNTLSFSTAISSASMICRRHL